MQLNQVFTLALPIIALLVSQAIQQNHWSKLVNLIVALVTIVGASLLTLVIQGKITGDIYGDILLVGAASAALQSDGLAPLQQYLRDNLLDFSPAPANPNPVRVPVALPTNNTPPPPTPGV